MYVLIEVTKVCLFNTRFAGATINIICFDNMYVCYQNGKYRDTLRASGVAKILKWGRSKLKKIKLNFNLN